MAAKNEQIITVRGHEYDINKDFTWEELLAVEEFSGQPLGAPGALESMATAAGFIFVILRRTDKDLTRDQFLKTNVADYDEAPNGNGNGAGGKKRPTRAAKAAA